MLKKKSKTVSMGKDLEVTTGLVGNLMGISIQESREGLLFCIHQNQDETKCLDCGKQLN